MRSFRNLTAALVAIISLGISGCGGNGLDQQSGFKGIDPMGEGNIPIGRAQGKEMGESAVHIEMSDGRIYNTFTKQQVVFAPSLPQGMTRITITPANRKFSRYEFAYYVGSELFWNFNVRPTDRLAARIVKSIDTSLLEGSVFHVGDSVELNIQLYGSNLEDVRPTVYLSGGLGRIDENDRIEFTKVGLGQVEIEVAGFQRSINIAVVP